MINNKLLLCVEHKIFLTKDELEFLKINDFVETTGVSIPVWLNIDNGKTSEPAREIFCAYVLYNDSKTDCFIDMSKNGYEIFLPQKKEWKPPEPVNFEKLSQFDYQKRLLFEKKRNLWWERNPMPPCLEFLLESKNLNFEIRKSEIFDKIKIIIKHTIQINMMEILKESIIN
jgi:hypothetical protein